MSVVAQMLDRSNSTTTPTTPDLNPTHSINTNSLITPPTAVSGSTFHIIESSEQFCALETEWTALQNSNHDNRISFQTHAWLRAWFTAYRDEIGSRATTIAIVLARTNGALRLACPLAVQNVLGMTCLTWLGEPASQYGDIITDGSQAAEDLIEPAITFALDQLQPDIIHLRKVRNDAAIRPWIKSQNALSTADDEAPYLDLRSAASFNDYCAKYSGKSRKNRRRLRRRLEEIDKVTTTILPPGQEAKEAIRTGLSFKQTWLVERGQISSALRDPHMVEFLTKVVGENYAASNPFVSVMRCGDKPVSVQFGIVSQSRLALHMIAYNPETEKTGAGVLHIEDTIAHSIDAGLSEIDFLAPNAAYKQAWADAAMPVADYVLARSMRGKLYTQAYLRATRALLKKQVEILPLNIRQSIAKRMSK